MKYQQLVAVGCAGALLLAGFAVGSPAQAQTFGGNESLSWSVPDVPTDGMASLTFPMTVGADTSRRSGTYFAMQFNFTGQSDVGYTGLQPRADVDGQQRLQGVFSSFIAGTTSSDPNCSDGADGGSGVSCSVQFDAVYGHEYDITVEQTATDTWSGSATDTTTGVSTHIGSYTLPEGSGLLEASQGGFVEYYNVTSCSEQPYYDISFGRPRSGELTGTVKWSHEYGECLGDGNTTVSDTADGGVRITRGTVDRPEVGLISAVRGEDGITITGWAPPGSRLKTTNDPDAGWYDPESGPVYAAADGSFTLVTNRTINGEVAVKAFDATTGAALGESNHLIPLTHVEITSPIDGDEVIGLPTVSGVGVTPNASVEVRAVDTTSGTSTTLGTAKAGDDGSWSLTSETWLTAGAYSLIANDGTEDSDPVTITVAAGGVAITSPTKDATVPSLVKVTGYAEPETKINIGWENDADGHIHGPAGSGTADSDGSWSAEMRLAAGKYNIYAWVDGNSSGATGVSVPVTVTSEGVTITSPTEDAEVLGTVTVTGSTNPGATLEVRADDADGNSTSFGTVAAGDDGAWTITSTTSLSKGSYTVYAVDKDTKEQGTVDITVVVAPGAALKITPQLMHITQD